MLNKWRWKRKRDQEAIRPASALEPGRWLSPAAGVEVSADGDCLVWFNTITGHVFTGNHVGALVWRAASQGLTFEATVEQVANRFGISRERAEQDIGMFVERLRQEGLAVREARNE